MKRCPLATLRNRGQRTPIGAIDRARDEAMNVTTTFQPVVVTSCAVGADTNPDAACNGGRRLDPSRAAAPAMPRTRGTERQQQVGTSVAGGHNRTTQRSQETADGHQAATPSEADRRRRLIAAPQSQPRAPGARTRPTGHSGTRGCERASNRPGTGRRRASVEHRSGHSAAADQGTPKGAP